jgi:uncharacterized NAD-dependent epimerase/dehydratase family protein
MRRYLILAPHAFASESAKTAHGVLRYGNEPVVAVIDPDHAGKRVCDVIATLRSEAPIVASVADGLRYDPTALLIGTAPKGGALPSAWRAEVCAALRAGLEIVSGLHEILGDDPEFAELARTYGTRIHDVRVPPTDIPLFSGSAYDVAPPVLLTVGNDCAVGKMTVALELVAAARRTGTQATFVPTGQTGILVAGWGIAIDRVVADFATGAAERLVLGAAARNPDLIVVEGQGGINHPAYAQVTLALLFGCAPDALLLVCDVARRSIESYGTPLLDESSLIRTYESLCATVKPAPVVAVALNTRGLDDACARAAVERTRRETGLPADDVVRFGADALWAAIAPRIRKRAPLGRRTVSAR